MAYHLVSHFFRTRSNIIITNMIDAKKGKNEKNEYVRRIFQPKAIKVKRNVGVFFLLSTLFRISLER